MNIKLSENAIKILESRYLKKDKITGKPCETVEQMFERVARNVASVELTDENKEYWYKKFYEAMTNLEFLPNSPTLINAGANDFGMYFACFVLHLADEIANGTDGIYDQVKNTVLIFKHGGGVGMNYSHVRPEGSLLKSTGTKASGVISFLKVMNESTNSIKQGGCFVEDTLVATPSGAVKIKDLKYGDFVYSMSEDGFCISKCACDAWLTKRNTEVWNLVTDENLSIIATPDHPFMPKHNFSFKDRNYVKLKNLSEDYKLMAYNMSILGDRRCVFRVEHNVSSISAYGNADVWNVEIENTHNFIVCNESMSTGVVVSNTRRGANMGVLNIDHPDILDWIHAKRNFPELSGFNLSIAITDEFIDRLLSAPDTPHIVKHDAYNNGEEDFLRTKIRNFNGDIIGYEKHIWTVWEIWDEIVKRNWENGDPGLLFIDRINKFNPLKEQIEATNPCAEQVLINNEACNLGSINLHKCVATDKQGHKFFNYNKFEDLIILGTRFLDNVIDASPYQHNTGSVGESIEHNVKTNRKIGLGIMGFASTLYELGLVYGSKESIEFAKNLIDFLNEISHTVSVDLAKEKNCAPVYLDPDKFIDYNKVQKRRNLCTTTIAPTGTIATIANCSYAIEPVYSLVLKRKILSEKSVHSDDYMLEVNDVFKDYVERRFDKDSISGIYEDILNGMSAVDVAKKYYSKVINTESANYTLKYIIGEMSVFVTAHDIDADSHINMLEVFSSNIDAAISKTVNIPECATIDDVNKVLMKALRSKYIRGIVVYRDNSVSNQPMSKNKITDKEYGDKQNLDNTGSTNKTNKICPDYSKDILDDLAQEMPAIRYRRNTSLGKLHTSIVYDDDTKKPIECFNSISKPGTEVNATVTAIGRLISYIFKLDGDIDKVVALLDGLISNPVMGKFGSTSLPDAIAQNLKQFSNKFNREVTLEESLNGGNKSLHTVEQIIEDKKFKPSLKTGNFCPVCNAPLYKVDGCRGGKCLTVGCNYEVCS